MKAVGYRKSRSIDAPDVLEDIELPVPEPGPHDLLVRVRAVSVNPLDVKVRLRSEPAEGYQVLGFDAAGVVEAVGDQVTRFRPGDEVFYAGDITRPGTNAELHAVDERIVGRKPASLTMPEAAAVPLTAITAWEILFDSFRLKEGDGEGETLLIVGGAGGVGSILIQLARVLTRFRVVVTASREETRRWCLDMGAHEVIDHRRSLAEQARELDLSPGYVASLTASDKHYSDLIALIRPRGQIAMIDDPEGLDMTAMKPKALSLHWEFMFTRPMFNTPDMSVQYELLNRVGELLDTGDLKTTLARNLGPLKAKNLIEAHRLQESGRAIGKTVLDGITA